MAVLPLTLSDDFSTGNIESSKQRCGAVTNVVVSNSFNIAQAHRQYWLSPFQRLALAFFVNAQHQRVLRWVEVKADNVADFFYEERIV